MSSVRLSHWASALCRWLILAFAVIAPCGPAAAADLVIGRASEQSSMDPLFSRTGNNSMTAQHIFDRLVATDADNQIHPALAASWRTLDPTTWEIKLRPGVKFHDGSDFTVEDVVFSVRRARNVPNSPAPFTGAVGAVAEMTIVDPLTLRIRTPSPTPQLIEDLGIVFIVSHKAAANATSDDFNSGKATIGTGPYKFVEWSPGQRVVLARNDAYWGPRPEFDKVTFKFISKDASRVAALLAGDVHLIDQVAPSDVKEIAKSGKANVFSIASTRLVYVALDSNRDASPFVTDAKGQPMTANPLKDARVRVALSKLINRRLLVERLLEGSGEAAGQMVPEGVGGFDPSLKPPEQDVEGAKKLLVEAGYPGGFGLTLHSSNDRLPKDAAVAQAIGQMWARGGIKLNGVVALPYSVYATAATKREYSAFIFSFGTTTPNSAIALNNVLATYDAAAGMGAFNRARYSNPAFDAALKRALTEFDSAKRNASLQEAGRIAFNEAAIVPLYWQVLHWAARKGIGYVPSRDESTLAANARIAR